TYVHTGASWRRPRLPRMDCVIVLQPKADLVVTEPRRVKKGQLVAVGTAADGSQGILVHSEGFLGGGHSANEFGFMQTAVSRERPVDYAVLAQLLGEERQRGGKILWVVGPALVHARAREDMVWFIQNGYVQAFLGGNAVAVHDLEAAIFGTTLGMSSSGEGVEGGRGLHMRASHELRPLTTICVDQTEFVVNKLRDRGTHQAYGVVTNAQDFMHVLRFYVERWEQAQAPATILR